MKKAVKTKESFQLWLIKRSLESVAWSLSVNFDRRIKEWVIILHLNKEDFNLYRDQQVVYLPFKYKNTKIRIYND